MNQQNESKPILDVCCGGRMFYFDKGDPRVLFCDIRTFDGVIWKKGNKRCRLTISPDIVCDFTNLPFPDNSFHAVVYDPPHLKYTSAGALSDERYETTNPERPQPKGWMMLKYGVLHRDWRDMLRRGFSECFRVLNPHGVLIFKWNETNITVSEVLALTPEKPVFGNRCGKKSKTHWICFLKGEKK